MRQSFAGLAQLLLARTCTTGDTGLEAPPEEPVREQAASPSVRRGAACVAEPASRGTTASRRFLRPFVWQDAPQSVLPEELRDGPVAVPDDWTAESSCRPKGKTTTSNAQ